MGVSLRDWRWESAACDACAQRDDGLARGSVATLDGVTRSHYRPGGFCTWTLKVRLFAGIDVGKMLMSGREKLHTEESTGGTEESTADWGKSRLGAHDQCRASLSRAPDGVQA